MRIATLIVTFVLLLAACGPAEEEVVEEPAPPPEDPGAVVAIEGTLAGDPQLEGGCVWLEADEGTFEVFWPEGYRHEADPVRLLGPDGETVAEEGDRLRVEGAVAEDAVSICQVGPIFSATSVQVVSS